jgi:predicted nucleic acid-binding Zn ribbon protein
MSKGLRRIQNHLTNNDPLWSVVELHGFTPKHDRKFKKVKYCVVCGQPTYKNSRICTKRCFKRMIFEKQCSLPLKFWYTTVIQNKRKDGSIYVQGCRNNTIR